MTDAELPFLSESTDYGPFFETRWIGAYLVAVGLITVYFLNLRFGDSNFTLSDLFLVLAFLMLIINGNNKLQSIYKFPGTIAIWILGAVAISMGLGFSSFVNGVPNRGLIVVVQYGFVLLLIPFVLSFISTKMLEKLLMVLLVSLTVVSASGIILYYVLTDFASAFMIGGRMGSFLGNPNHLGKSLGIMLPTLLYFWFLKKLSIISFITIGLIFIWSLMLSGSLGGLFVSIGSLGFFVVLTVDLKKYMRIGALSGLVGGMIAAFIRVPEIFSDRVIDPLIDGDVGSLGSFEVKVILAKEAWKLVKERPIIGYGADSFRDLSASGNAVHNTYLLLWVEGGIIAFLGWLVLLIIIGYHGIRLWKRENSRMLGALLLSTLAAFSASALTNTHMYSSSWYMVLYMVAFLAISRSHVD